MDALSGIPRGRGSSLVQCGGCLPALVALDTKDGFKVMVKLTLLVSLCLLIDTLSSITCAVTNQTI